jgi:hypothetical protein
VTFYGMVWLRTVVLGRMGRTENSHPRASALSCPPFAIYGPGFSGTRPSFLNLDFKKELEDL